MIKFSKKSIFIILFSVVFLFAIESIAAGSGMRYSIVVSKFKNRSNWRGQWNLGDAWGAVLTENKQRNKGYHPEFWYL